MLLTLTKLLQRKLEENLLTSDDFKDMKDLRGSDLPLALLKAGFVILKTDVVLDRDLLNKAATAVVKIADSIFHEFDDIDVTPEELEKLQAELLEGLLPFFVQGAKVSSDSYLCTLYVVIMMSRL